MKHFYRVTESVPTAAIMSALMEQQDILQVSTDDARISYAWLREGGTDKLFAQLPQAKRLALGVMQLVEGSALGSISLERLAAGGRSFTLPLEPGFTRYCVTLLASPGATYNAGDETINLRAGEIWWADGALKEATLANESSDDMIVLSLDIKLD